MTSALFMMRIYTHSASAVKCIYTHSMLGAWRLSFVEPAAKRGLLSEMPGRAVSCALFVCGMRSTAVDPNLSSAGSSKQTIFCQLMMLERK